MGKFWRPKVWLCKYCRFKESDGAKEQEENNDGESVDHEAEKPTSNTFEKETNELAI